MRTDENRAGGSVDGRGVAIRDRRAPVLAAMVLLFAVFTALGLHGYSTPKWHRWIDASPMSEVIAGEPRAIRSDDWSVVLPLALAQRISPPVPRLQREHRHGREHAGSVLNARVAPADLFRPTIWGWFLSADTGLAWMWWSRTLGLFTAIGFFVPK